MRSYRTTFLVLLSIAAACPLVSLVLSGTSVASGSFASGTSDNDISKQLVGSWRIVSASFGGVPSELHRNSITIKHITPVHVIWIGYQPDDRRIFRSAGGSWKVVNGKYTETMRYGLDEKFRQNTFGRDFAFDCRFEGDLWIQSATLPNGSEMIETWQRIKPDEDVSMRPADIKQE
ncbi:MAG: hypothetical protein JNL58_20225 [Planctomyces sp.]|nr:hypothetical protein [Planctomyces sp.]